MKCKECHWFFPTRSKTGRICPSKQGWCGYTPVPKAYRVYSGDVWADDRKVCETFKRKGKAK